MPSLPPWTPTPVRKALRRARRTLLRVGSPSLSVRVADPAELARLCASGARTGRITRLTVRVSTVPETLIAGIRPPRLGRTSLEFTWRRRRGGLWLRMRWSEPYDAPRALREAAFAVLRVRPLPQTSGPVYTVDRDAWLSGATSWPQGHPAGHPPTITFDQLGRPLGAFLPAEPRAVDDKLPPLFTSAVNPIGRTLVGAATHYRLEALPANPDKYAVVSVDGADIDTSTVERLRTLAACGVVFASTDGATRARLAAVGLVTVRDPAEVNDLRGYALSIEASRRMAITGDAVLRRTALAGDGAVPLPTVSVVLSSKRADDIEACLGYLASQTYPSWEVVLGLHGYEVPESTVDRWRELIPTRLRVLPLSSELTFGMVLGRLSRVADGELLTKVDDDDRYGANHLTDLVVAWHTSGADVVAKGSRFVYFPEADETMDRRWTAPEQFQVTPAGGTIMISRSTLADFGGWSHSPKHVDTDLLVRVKSGGGLVYRTHGLEYVYVRRSTGHTWHTELDDIRAQGEKIYPGLPAGILAPDYAPVSPEYSAK